MKKIISTILIAMSVMGAFSADAATTKVKNDPDSRVVYSVYLRNFTNPDGSGTFNDLRADLPRLKDLGVDVIHLLPFYEMGIEHAKGSPYCIRDYNKVDPRYGTLEDLKSLVNDIHDNGMEIWFDMVANHTAYDNPWVKDHPEWYTERQDFDDVRSVNSSNKDLRRAMADCMKYWVEECGIDGFRCDFAHAPGRDFWIDIVEMVDPEHKLYWLGEGNEEGIANDWMRAENGPFDSRYGWTFAEFMYEDKYDRKNQTVKGDLDQAVFHLGYPQDRATFLTYLGSHDIYQGMKPQVSPNTQDVIYGDNLIPFTVVTMMAPGLPMVYMGQEINYSKPGGVGILSDHEAIDWSRVDSTYYNLIKNLIALRHDNTALHTQKGILVNHNTTSDSVYVFERRYGNESVLVMVNLSPNAQTFNITSPTLPHNVYKEVFTSMQTDLTNHTNINIEPKGYKIFIKKPGQIRAKEYKITANIPEAMKGESAPLIYIYTPDPLKHGGNLAIVDHMPMNRNIDGSYSYSVPYLPDFGYEVVFINPETKQQTQPIKQTKAADLILSPTLLN